MLVFPEVPEKGILGPGSSTASGTKSQGDVMDLGRLVARAITAAAVAWVVLMLLIQGVTGRVAG